MARYRTMMVQFLESAKLVSSGASSFDLRGFKTKALSFLAASCLLAMAPAVSAREVWHAPENITPVENPLGKDKVAIERGKALYLDRCIDCHGKKGKGDGPGGADLPLQPPDFAKPQVRQQSDGAIFWKLSEGRKPMPGYGRKLSEEERWSLVAYVRSLSGH